MVLEPALLQYQVANDDVEEDQEHEGEVEDAEPSISEHRFLSIGRGVCMHESGETMTPREVVPNLGDTNRLIREEVVQIHHLEMHASLAVCTMVTSTELTSDARMSQHKHDPSRLNTPPPQSKCKALCPRNLHLGFSHGLT